MKPYSLAFLVSIFFIKTVSGQAVTPANTDTIPFSYEFDDWTYCKGQAVNNIKVGLWHYTPNDSIRISGQYKNGRQSGKWVYTMLKNAIPFDTIAILNYNEGLLDGSQVSYHNGDTIAAIMNYSKGLRHGSELTYFPEGNLHEMLNYNYGVPIGTYSRFNKNGTLYGKIIYERCSFAHFDHMLDSAQTLVIKETGNSESSILNIDQLDPKDFSRIKLYTLDYVNGLPHGDMKAYDTAGTKRALGHYHHGVPVGTWTRFNRKGKVQMQISLKDDPAHSSLGPYLFMIKHQPIPRYFSPFISYINIDELEKEDLDLNHYLKNDMRTHPYALLLNNDIEEQNRLSMDNYLQSHRKEILDKSLEIHGIDLLYSFQLNERGEIINANVQQMNNPEFEQYIISLLFQAPNMIPDFRFGIPIISQSYAPTVGIKTLK